MKSSYEEFLANKAIIDAPTGIMNPTGISEALFPFQRAVTKWGLQRGRAAFFEGTGLGKTPQQIEWARHVENFTDKPVLIVAPLAVSHQTINEAKKILGYTVKFATTQADVGARGIYVTNYQKLDHFNPEVFGGVVLDESSILKSQDGATKQKLIEAFANTPFRLCCTATPAPNDYMELGNHAEFLGVMRMNEMLSTFFVHDGGETQKWRLKGHAEKEFWKWMASWAICIQKPSDIGFEDDGYILPELVMHEIIVDCGDEPLPGELFPMPAKTLQERRDVRRGTISQRAEKCKEIITDHEKDQWLVWCNLNAESEAATKILSAAEITGSDSDEHKEAAMLGFSEGHPKDIVSKPSICGFGMNWQNCHNVIFLGLSDSFDQFYQAIRRCYRFGQTEVVHVFIVISSMEGEVLKNIKRKEQDAEKMSAALVEHMADLTKKQLTKSQSRKKVEYKTEVKKGDGWEMHLGDCVEGVRKLADNSIGFSIFSPPFASLYCYSASDRDMGNSKNHAEFYNHFKFLVSELMRVTMPGRLVSFHCMNLPTSKTHDGYIGIQDFRGNLIRIFQEAGWIYHSEVTIWKDPVTSMQRTKAIGLLHKQVAKDSCMSRQGLPDYLVTMRKPGVNANPVTGEFALDDWFSELSQEGFESFCRQQFKNRETDLGDGVKGAISPMPFHTFRSVMIWQKYASPVWMDINPSDTLQFRSAREHADEKHICPLQLEVIRRALCLWSNPGDTVLSPFAGIASEGYESISEGRNFIGFELKESYFRQAVANMQSAEAKKKEQKLL